MTNQTLEMPITEAAQHAEHHAPQSFISKYVFSRDHKVVGVQYLFTAAFAALVSGDRKSTRLNSSH